MPELERRELGRTGLSISVLGLGAMDLGGPPAANEISDEDLDGCLMPCSTMALTS